MLEFCLWDVLSEVKCIASFEDYLDFSVLNYSSEFFTPSLDVRDFDKGFLGGSLGDCLVHMRPMVWFFEETVRVAVPVQKPY